MKTALLWNTVFPMMQHKFAVKLVLECYVREGAFVRDEIHISFSYLWVLDANNYELGLRQSPNKVVIMTGTDSQAREEQVFIGSHRCDHSWGVSRLAEEKHCHFGKRLLMPGVFCGHRLDPVKGRGRRGERGCSGESTTWITGLKGWTDAVNLSNREQKTASLLTSPLLHFHWQLPKTHMLSRKAFQKELQLGFFHQLWGIFFIFILPTNRTATLYTLHDRTLPH